MMLSYSIKLYDEKKKSYEYLTEVLAGTKKEAIEKFRDDAGWIDLPDTLLFAAPPLCR